MKEYERYRSNIYLEEAGIDVYYDNDKMIEEILEDDKDDDSNWWFF